MKKCRVQQDVLAENPRECEYKIGHFSFAHRRYDLGDADCRFNSDDYDGWNEVRKMLIKKRDAHLLLEVSMIDHSGQRIYVGAPSCSWDSGQIGFAWMTKAEIIELCGELDEKKATEILTAEVERYNNWRNGDVYEAEILNEDNEVIDSFSGFASEEEARDYAETLIKDGHWN